MDKQIKTILIVDDVDDIREGLSFILEDQGYLVEQANNGVTALCILRTKKIDLLVTDILMPDMDGIELIQQVRDNFSRLPFILISGGGRQLETDSNFNYLDSAKKLTGAKHILKKPFRAEELITVVNELLQ